MKDGRSEPGHPKKRSRRVGGGPARGAAESRAGKASESRRRKPEDDRRASDDFRRRGSGDDRRASDDFQRRGSGDDRRGSEEFRRREAGDDRRRSGDAARRRESGRPARADGRREQAEPGFGPFRGRQRDGALGGSAPRRTRADDEARTVRSVAEEAVARASGEQRPALRIVHGTERRGPAPARSNGSAAGKGRGARRTTTGGAPAQRPKPVRDGARLQDALMRGARALERGYEREALRILRPWREAHPESAELRELLGVTYYRLARWALAQKELEAFVGLADSTEQHPVLMDVARALGRFKRVEQLWDELRAVSPSAELVAEGRIVYAGALADQGKLDEAIKVLARAPGNPKRVLPHHLRLWYALADLHERAGDIPAARALFRKISAQDPSFVDVAERLAALS